MAETYKILGQIAPGDEKEHVLYGTGIGNQAIVTNITVTNRNSGSGLVDINYYDSALSEADLADVTGTSPGFYGAISGIQGGNANFTYSADGISWSNVSVGQEFDLAGIGAGGGVFVAVNPYGAAAYSTNGTSWSSSTAPQGFYGQPTQRIAYGNGTFVTILQGQEGNTAYWTADGAQWSQATVQGQGSFNSGIWNVAYGNGVFVAVNDGSNFFAWSTNGQSWTIGSGRFYGLQGGAYIDEFDFVNGQFVITCGYPGYFIYSSDGQTWSQTSIPGQEGSSGLAYGNGSYIATRGNTIYKSSSLLLGWTEQTNRPIQNGYIDGADGLTGFDGTKFIIGCGKYSNQYLYSTDGSAWSVGNFPMETNPKYITDMGSGLVTFTSPVSNKIYSGITIDGYSFEVLEPGIVMQPSDTIVVKGTGFTTFTVYGVEIS